MRLPKSKSKNKPVIPNPGEDQVGKSGRVDMTDSFQNLNSSQPIPVNEQLLSRRRKRKSIFIPVVELNLFLKNFHCAACVFRDTGKHK